jgi:hypothetical protein
LCRRRLEPVICSMERRRTDRWELLGERLWTKEGEGDNRGRLLDLERLDVSSDGRKGRLRDMVQCVAGGALGGGEYRFESGRVTARWGII